MDKDYLDKVHQSIFRFTTFSGSYICGKIQDNLIKLLKESKHFWRTHFASDDGLFMKCVITNIPLRHKNNAIFGPQ